MPKRKKPGRKKELDTTGWRSIAFRMPEEVWRALRHVSYKEEIPQAQVVRELLERDLQKRGVLKVSKTKDDDGNDVKAYETTF